MSTRASAARYARALFDVALQEGSLDQANNDLTALTDLLQQHPDLQRVLVNPAIPAARKRAALEALLPKLSLSTPVSKLLLMLADRDRLVIFPDLVAVFRDRYLEHQHIVEAEVTTAMPLSAEREAELRQQLARVTGRHVNLTTRVDPAIIGGIVTRIGTIVYDGSLASQLTKMRDQLGQGQF
jgi:F-type H+-transporting ATPase subunit delta